MISEPKAPRLHVIAEILRTRVKGITVTLEKSWSSTDRKLAGTRLRHPGKGRDGKRLTVIKNSTGEVLIRHDSSQTYRHNSEVVREVKNLFGLDLMKVSKKAK